MYPIYNHNWRKISTIYIKQTGAWDSVVVKALRYSDGLGIDSLW